MEVDRDGQRPTSLEVVNHMPHRTTQFDPQKVQQIIDELQRLSSEVVDATGGNLAENRKLACVIDDLEFLITKHTERKEPCESPT